MKTLVKKEIVELINEFENNPIKYKNTMLYDLLMERKNLALKEEKVTNDLKKLQNELISKINNFQDEFLKIKGSIDIVEKMIIKHRNII